MNIVRDNLMNVPGYAPYCGAANDCIYNMPRTHFDGKQFVCRCGWRSNFPADFIKSYKKRWNEKVQS